MIEVVRPIEQTIVPYGNRGMGERLGRVVVWLLFPVVPVLLADLYHGVVCFGPGGPPDPRAWDWLHWVLMLGPLTGYAFLAGATIDAPDLDPPGRRGFRGLMYKRSLWVAVGPWAGFVFWGILAWVWGLIPAWMSERFAMVPDDWTRTWIGTALFWAVAVFVVATLSYGWLVPAVAALRRARRLGRGGASVRRGLAVMVAFVSSLFGGFWAITEAWRGYFFDARVYPVLLTGASLALLSGCGTMTYGEMRRRDLFHAMLLAWTLGLALLWRWWSRTRTRSKPPNSTR